MRAIGTMEVESGGDVRRGDDLNGDDCPSDDLRLFLAHRVNIIILACRIKAHTFIEMKRYC